MRRVLAISAGLLLWGAAAPGSAQPVTVPRPNPLRAAQATLPAPRPASAAQPFPPAAISPETPIPAPEGPADPVVIDVRIGGHADRTRFVVEFSDPVKFRIFTLASPDRLVIDMPEVLWRLKGPSAPSGTGAVRSYRYGLFRPGNSRFVIDLNRPVKTGEPMILPPQDGYGYRLVLDLFPATQAAFEQTAGWPADLRAREQAAAELASLPPEMAPAPPSTAPVSGPEPSRKVVVIDPGHGGIDSGTIGVTGLQEKDVVLDQGMRLAKVLRARGYTVYLTRTTDVFIPLYSRAPFARRHHADLFVSLHADSNPNPSVQGASIYTLSERGSDKEAAALAQKENQSDIIAGIDLSGDNSSVASILIDMTQRDTMNRSSRFAQTLVHQLSGVTDVLAREPHRSANFVVLRAPDVPAVLIELGYLSNDADCRQMATSVWRNRVAGALADAVERQLAPAMATAPGGGVE